MMLNGEVSCRACRVLGCFGVSCQTWKDVDMAQILSNSVTEGHLVLIFLPKSIAAIFLAVIALIDVKHES